MSEPDEMAKNADTQRRGDDKTCLSWWFPLIEAAGIPVPTTRIIKLGSNDYSAVRKHLLGEPAIPCLPMQNLLASIIEAANYIVGPGAPFFLRTGLTSAKHSWNETAYVKDWSKLGQHVYNLVEFSECCDMFGLPSDVWVVREMLRTAPMFYAFKGRMPITREFRYFVRDGKCESWQPYWPARSIEGHDPSRPDWRELLAAASVPPPELEALALRVSAAVPGYWSVDLLSTVDRGWLVTDMAAGERSFKWSPEDEKGIE